jgi:transcriptional regulator with XRE-family HTH domain
MKPAETIIGQEIQYFLLQQGAQLDSLAKQMKLTSEALSNLIHGRRRFKDSTLVNMANTELFTNGNFSLKRLKALRAMGEYEMSELILAVLNYIKRGEVQHLPDDFFAELSIELKKGGFPQEFYEKQHMLLSLIDSSEP